MHFFIAWYCTNMTFGYLCTVLKIRHHTIRDVAQSGLEYSSGGRGVAGSNPVFPTDENETVSNFFASRFFGGTMA